MGATNVPAQERMDFDVRAVDEAFRRGDANDDGAVDLSDPVMVFGCKFLGDACPTCRDAGDANDDGQLDISDGVFLLNFLFRGGIPPLPPANRHCGSDPTDDDIAACNYASC